MIAETLRTLGLNMDFAPVVDVIDAERSQHPNGLISREFGRSKEDVVSMAGAFLDELQRGGVIGCLKHFPGLGAARVDSHEELPQVDISESELENTDLYPYREMLAMSHAVMVAHATYPASSLQERDENGRLLPSSLSNNFISTLLRDRLGFDGVVITDDLEMGAIVKNYGIGEASKMAVKAEADMLAICADPQAIRAGYHAVLAAVADGDISEERLEASLARIAALKQKLSPPTPLETVRMGQISGEVAALVTELG
jgi:beta-N-acetylhexosaminidase